MVYGSCFDGDKQINQKAQPSVAKVILGYFKTTSSNNVLTDRDLTRLFQWREKISSAIFAK